MKNLHAIIVMLENFKGLYGFRTPVESWNKVRRIKDFPHRVLYHDSPFIQV